MSQGHECLGAFSVPAYEVVDALDKGAATGISVRISEDQRGLGKFLQCPQQFLHGAYGGFAGQSHWMVGNEEQRRAQWELERFGQLWRRHPRLLPQIVQPRRPHIEDTFGCFTELYYTLAIRFGSHEMPLRHFGDRMPNRLVEGAFGDFPAMDMGQGNPCQQSGLRCGQDLETVPKYQHDVRRQPLVRIGKANHAKAERFRDRDFRISRDQHVDSRVHGETVRFDLPDGLPEFGRQVHAGGDDLQCQGGISVNRPQGAAEQTILGARACDNADSACVRHARFPESLGLLGILIRLASSAIATGSSARGHSEYMGSLCRSVQAGRHWKPASFETSSKRLRASISGVFRRTTFSQ
ncbi:hypothetical protein D3C86_1340450 [compost metagenome]